MKNDASTAPQAASQVGSQTPAREYPGLERGLERGLEPGLERRRHRVYVTHNTEYHLRDRRCVAVRDRRTGEFLHGHLAIDRNVAGGLKFFVNGGIAPNAGEPRLGESIYFASEGRDLVTSPLESIERPGRDIVGGYPSPKTK